MLFILTGAVQTGKTRWLEELVATLAARGVPASGVLAPGQWVPSEGERADANGFEKLGIDNELLPGGERVSFARRGDLARAEGTFDETSQAAQAELAWHIDDAAIARVNEHFEGLAQMSRSCCEIEPALWLSENSVASGNSQKHCVRPGLLIVDELGRLEVWRGQGLTSALALLAEGPTDAFPHALVVVRDYLLEDAEALLASAWPDCARIAPNDKSAEMVLAAFDAPFKSERER